MCKTNARDDNYYNGVFVEHWAKFERNMIVKSLRKVVEVLRKNKFCFGLYSEEVVSYWDDWLDRPYVGDYSLLVECGKNLYGILFDNDKFKFLRKYVNNISITTSDGRECVLFRSRNSEILVRYKDHAVIPVLSYLCCVFLCCIFS